MYNYILEVRFHLSCLVRNYEPYTVMYVSQYMYCTVDLFLVILSMNNELHSQKFMCMFTLVTHRTTFSTL